MSERPIFAASWAICSERTKQISQPPQPSTRLLPDLSEFSHLILEQVRCPGYAIRRVLVGKVKRPPQADGADTECQEFQDIRPEASTTLREHLDLAKEFRGFVVDLDGYLQRRGCRVDSPSTVLYVCQLTCLFFLRKKNEIEVQQQQKWREKRDINLTFERMTAGTPCATASRTSSTVWTPFKMTGKSVIFV